MTLDGGGYSDGMITSATSIHQHPHSTREMASLWGLFKGVSVDYIFVIASWASHTFFNLYCSDVTASSLACSGLNEAC